MSFLRPKSESCFIDLFSDREKMKTFIYATEKSLRKCTQQQIRNVKFPEQNKKLMNSLFNSSIKWKRFFFLRLKWKRNNKIIERFSDELSIFDQMQKKKRRRMKRIRKTTLKWKATTETMRRHTINHWIAWDAWLLCFIDARVCVFLSSHRC